MEKKLLTLIAISLIGAANMFAMKENVVNSGLTMDKLNTLVGPSKLGATKFNEAKGTATFSLADFQAWVKAGKPAPGPNVPPAPAPGGSVKARLQAAGMAAQQAGDVETALKAVTTAEQAVKTAAGNAPHNAAIQQIISGEIAANS